jgi:hypothetical protein
LKALLSVVILLAQKLIKIKEVIPINSQPKIKVIQLPAINNRIMDSTKNFKKKKKLTTPNSLRIYEKA